MNLTVNASSPRLVARAISTADEMMSGTSEERRPLWGVMAALAVFTLLCVIQRQGQVLTLAFTPLVLMGGVYLLKKSAALYLSFCLWIWCLAPLVRRLADYVSWYRPQSTVLLAPALVSILGLVTVWRRRDEIFQPRTLAFLLPAAGILYGLLLGFIRNPINVVVTVGIRWLVPIVFALFLYFSEDDKRTLAQEFQKTLIAAAVASGAYALLQFVHPAPWDTFWLTNVSVGMVAPSFGLPEPFAIRVFGPLYAPGLLAGLLACGMVMLVGQRVLVLAIAAPIVTLALMLTKIRTAWLGAALGLFYLFSRSDAQKRLKLLIGAVLVALTLPVLLNSMGSSVEVSDRFSSFLNLSHDESAQSRAGGIGDAISVILHEPLGMGLGYLDSDAYLRSTMATHYEVAAHDMGILELLLELGMLGAGLYFLGMLLLVNCVIHQAKRNNSAAIVGLVTMCVSFLAYTPTSNALIYFDGILFWSAAALLLHHDLEMSEPKEDSSCGVPIPPRNLPTLHRA
jgi:hypothetical protein